MYNLFRYIVNCNQFDYGSTMVESLNCYLNWFNDGSGS